MRHPLHRHALHLARGTFKGLLIATLLIVAVLVILLVLFVIIWGWHRFKGDFWPLDRSYIGPNLVAGWVVTIGVIAHNEYKATLHAVETGESARATIKTLEQEIVAPVATAEEHIAENVAEDINHD